MQWFRQYAEFATDPKVQMMSESYQRRLVMLFCMRCNGSETLHDEEIAFQLRVSNEEWKETKAEFVRRNFIDNDNKILNWDKRQYVSDTSTERVRAHREKKKQDVKQQCNVSETPPDTDTDTEKKKIKKEIDHPDFGLWYKAYPLKKSRVQASKAFWKAIKKVSFDELLSATELYKRNKPDWQEWAYPSSWLNHQRWLDDYSAPVKQAKPQAEEVMNYAFS